MNRSLDHVGDGGHLVPVGAIMLFGAIALMTRPFYLLLRWLRQRIPGVPPCVLKLTIRARGGRDITGRYPSPVDRFRANGADAARPKPVAKQHRAVLVRGSSCPGQRFPTTQFYG
jgi:hypothetical protein